MAFNKQVRYSFIWITETLAGEQLLSQVSSMTFRSIFSMDPISVALKRNPGQFFNGIAVYSDSRNLAAYFWRYQINPKDSKRPVSYSLIDV